MIPIDKNHLTRILMAEDDLTSRTILAAVLKKWGFEVVVSRDGQAAWEILKQPDAPRLVILDWIMPQMDGLEVLRQVRAMEADRPAYIIILTSRSDKNDIVIGLEAGADDYIKKPFDNDELFARIRVGQRTLELQNRLYETQKILAHLATHDPLTGILNRRAILEHLGKEISRARRSATDPGNLVSIGVFDLDYFKQVNDQYGHQIGDEVLCGLVNVISKNLREYDFLGRMGGDEFLAVAPGINQVNRTPLFERLSSAISAKPIMTKAGGMSVTVSIGVATARVDSTMDQLLEIADAAMYQAKQGGRNRVGYAEETP